MEDEATQDTKSFHHEHQWKLHTTHMNDSNFICHTKTFVLQQRRKKQTNISYIKLFKMVSIMTSINKENPGK